MTDWLSANGFRVIDEGDRWLYLREGVDESLLDALRAPESLEPLSGEGRASVYRFPLEDGDAVIRPYRRGGAAAKMSNETYQFGNRAADELRVLREAEALGVAVSSPLGGLWERRGNGLGGAIATRLVPGETLESYCRAGVDATPVLERCGEVIRGMHDAGIYHADLQIRNILVNAEEVTLIDFDGALKYPSLGRILSARNLLRLRRSIEKNGLDVGTFQTVLRGYGKVSLPLWLRAGYRIKGQLSDLLRSGSS